MAKKIIIAAYVEIFMGTMLISPEINIYAKVLIAKPMIISEMHTFTASGCSLTAALTLSTHDGKLACHHGE